MLANQQAAAYFRKANNHKYAKETYIKMEDLKALMAVRQIPSVAGFKVCNNSFCSPFSLQLYVETHQWQDAFLLVQQRPEFAQDIYLPYAEWLAIHGKRARERKKQRARIVWNALVI